MSIADDFIYGTCCSICSSYFVKKEGKKEVIYTHGYPVVCKSCWKDLSEKEKKNNIQAEAETI